MSRRYELIEATNGGWILFENSSDPGAYREPMAAFSGINELLAGLRMALITEAKLEGGVALQDDGSWRSVPLAPVVKQVEVIGAGGGNRYSGSAGGGAKSYSKNAT